MTGSTVVDALSVAGSASFLAGTVSLSVSSGAVSVTGNVAVTGAASVDGSSKSSGGTATLSALTVAAASPQVLVTGGVDCGMGRQQLVVL